MKIEITSLRVVNCGPLKDVRIDFTDKETGKPLPVVLLAGANGSGKTTALEVMYGLAQLLDPAIKEIPDVLKRSLFAIMECTIDGTPFSFHYGRLSTHDSGTLAKENAGWSVVIDYPNDPMSPFFTDYSDYSWTTPTRFVRKIQTAIVIGRAGHLPRNGFDMGSADYNSNIDYAPSILYFPHYRAVESVEGQEIRREPTQYQWTHKYEVVKSFAGSLSSYLIWLDYAEPETFQSVKVFLDNLYPDNKSFEINRRDLKAVVRVAGGFVHDVDKLSSGEQNLLIMLLELRRRLLPGSIVLIDELENSLHPAFQHRLAQGLLQLQREIPFQLIATTHAETFVDIFGTKATRILPMPSASLAEVK